MGLLDRQVTCLNMVIFFVVSVLGCAKTEDAREPIKLHDDVRELLSTAEASRLEESWPVNYSSENGIDSKESIGGVIFRWNIRLTDEHADLLNELPNLTVVIAEYSEVDFSFLEKLASSKIRLLVLSNSNVGDKEADVIAKFRELKLVVINNTEMTSRGLKVLRNAESNLKAIAHPM